MSRGLSRHQGGIRCDGYHYYTHKARLVRNSDVELWFGWENVGVTQYVVC